MFQNLIPLLLKTAGGNERHQKIALACTDLLTSLTWPVNANEAVQDADAKGEDIEHLAQLFTLEQGMVKYKAAILRQRLGETTSGKDTATDKDALGSIMRFVLLPALAKPRPMRTERDVGTISMVLHLFRNLLAIRDPISTTLASNEQIANGQLQSELVCAMSKSHVLETILMLANSAESREFGQWNAVTAECVYTIFGGEFAGVIAGIEGLQAVDASRDGKVGSTSAAAVAKRDLNRAALASSLSSEAHQKRVNLTSNGSSRHSRFGTTLNFFNADGERRVARNQPSLRKTVEELRQENAVNSRRKFRRRRRARELGSPHARNDWTPEAKTILADWADRFLLTLGFETLVRSVLEDIRREREKMGDLDQARVHVMILAAFFLDYFLIRRNQEAHARKKTREALRQTTVNASGSPAAQDKGKAKATDSDDVVASDQAGQMQQPDDEQAPPKWSFTLLSEWLKPWAFRMVSSRSASALDAKVYLELTASLHLWISLLHIVDALSQSSLDSEKDVAESLQSNHFYHAETLDLCLKITRCYSTTQSLEFLERMVEFVNVMSKLLERYSTNKEHIFVRAKRHVKKARAAKKTGDQVNDDDEDDDDPQLPEDEETAARAETIYSDRRFSFQKFQSKLCNRSLVEGCVAYLGRWRDYARPAEQLANVISIMHRIAIKAGDVRSFYPEHIRIAFRSLLKGPLVATLSPKAPRASVDAKKLLEYCLKKYDKLSQEEKDLWQFGKPAPKPVKAIKIPKEIEVKPGMGRDEQVGVAIGLLAERGMMNSVTWLKDALEIASAEKTALVLTIDGKRMWGASRRTRIDEGEEDVPEDPTEEDREAILDALQDASPSDEAVAAFEPFTLAYPSPLLQEQATMSPPTKLLLRLMGLESDEDDDIKWLWRIPSTVLPMHLNADAKLIEAFIQDPLSVSSGSFESYVQTRRKPRQKTIRARHLAPDDISDDASGSSSESEAQASDSEQRPARRRRKRQDLAGDPRKKKKQRGFTRGKPSQPLFLQDDIIESDEEAEADRLWEENQQRLRGDGPVERPRAKPAQPRASSPVSDEDEGNPISSFRGRRIGRSSSISRHASRTPDTSPAVGDSASPSPVKTQVRASRRLFLDSSDEDDDEPLVQEASKTAASTAGTSNRWASPTPSEEPDKSGASRKRGDRSGISLSGSEDEAGDVDSVRVAKRSRVAGLWDDSDDE